MEHSFEAVNWLAVIVATLSAFVIGGLWYGPLLGKPWQRLAGVTDEDIADTNMVVTYGVAFVLELVAATVLALFIGAESSLGAGMAVAAHFAIVVLCALGVNYLFSNRTLKLYAIDAGYFAILFPVMGAILGAW